MSKTMDSSAQNTMPQIFSLPKRIAFVRKFITDLLIISSILFGIIIFYKFGIPFRRGFHCQDDSIRYPFKENTIPTTVNYLYSTLLPACTILVNEIFLTRQFLMVGDERFGSVWSSGKYWLMYSWQCYLHLIPLAFGAVTSQFITDIAKYSIGRLRPHFLDMCRPQLSTGSVVNRITGCVTPNTYETDYTCTNFEMDPWRVKDVHLSFVSGHTSFAAVCLIYLVIYIQVRIKYRWLGLLKQFYQASLFVLVLWTGFTRISDYKHHWSDVLFGFLLGALIAILIAKYGSNLFRSPESKRQQADTNVKNGNLQESGV
ncbi:hypothetical protein RDWZM_009055 [Blomia tropicalis]|uniref:Phosphatidic acid phosphatase type 2/haloperoxidase domain-containing protein n=1 Tax=Blomia tropicalis TaxID=40697 RepID=A0A9Q0RJD9_BLOTA|nr:hypothetical protein RDWZM_009055 [Blomia tropicalis]